MGGENGEKERGRKGRGERESLHLHSCIMENNNNNIKFEKKKTDFSYIDSTPKNTAVFFSFVILCAGFELSLVDPSLSSLPGEQLLFQLACSTDTSVQAFPLLTVHAATHC